MYEVLVVVPEALLQRKVTEILAGFKVTACARADDAVMQLRSQNFHCVVVDASLAEFLPCIRMVNENAGIVLLERRKGVEVETNGIVIWDTVPAPYPIDHLTRAVREASEIAAMPPEQSKRLADGFEREATAMRKIGHDALNDTGIFSPIKK